MEMQYVVFAMCELSTIELEKSVHCHVICAKRDTLKSCFCGKYENMGQYKKEYEKRKTKKIKSSIKSTAPLM